MAGKWNGDPNKKNISINKIKKRENTHPCDKTDLVPSLQFLSYNLNKYL